MARPVNANAAETKARVLQSACRLFATRGKREASVRAVAHGADVSLAMIHHYFGSKDGLYDAALASSYGSLASNATSLAQRFAELPARLDGVDESAAAIVEETIRHGVALAREEVDAIRLLMGTLVGPRPAGRWHRDVVRPFIDEGSAALAGLTHRPAEALRLPLQSLLALVMRYVVAFPPELCAMAGVTPRRAQRPTKRETERAWSLVEDHLVEVAQRMLLTEVP